MTDERTPQIDPGYKIGGAGVKYSPEEKDLLARLINGEARGEVYEGQVAVGAVVLNRVKSPDYPNTIPEVIFHRIGRYPQFSAVSEGQVWLTPSASSLQAAQDALDGNDPTGGAIGFFNPVKVLAYDPRRRNWVWTRPAVRTIGNHRFYR